MKDKYKELFEDVHLSESAMNNIKQEQEKLQDEESKKVIRYGGRKLIKAAALLGVLLALGGTASYAVAHFSNKHNNIKMNKELQDKRAEITIKNEVENTGKVDTKKTSVWYDVNLSYIPQGYKQDKEDSYLYRDKKGEGYFSVILYHLHTEYRTVRSSNKIKEIETELAKGYIGGRSGAYFAIMTLKDKNYMVYIDGSNMSRKEVEKIARGASLTEVKSKKNIQASYIEYTKEKRAESDQFIKKATEKIGKK